MLITVGGEKGGTGKTSVASNLAVCYALRNHDVCLVDSDPQLTAARWAERRAEQPEVRSIRYQELMCRGNGQGYFAALQDLRERYETVIVDVAGADSVGFRAAVASSDLLLSPLIPSQCDSQTSESIAEVVAQVRGMGNTELRALFVLNQCPTHARSEEVAETREELERALEHLEIANTQIAYRKAFRKAYRMSLGVVELSELEDRNLRRLGTDAASEIWNLYREVSGDESGK